jgi:general secretion pathway protein I
VKQLRGFTLIEVLVALGIVAIALVAGLQATAALTFNAQRQSDVLLAHLCAENELTRLRLSRQMPGVGDSEATCEQAGQAFTVRLKVAGTPNPSFRRIDAQVFSGGFPLLKISTVLGRF